MSEIGQRVIAAVRKVAEERPGFVYKAPLESTEDGEVFHTGNCVYVHNGEPSCIVGQALWREGIITKSFEANSLNEMTVTRLIDEGFAGLDALDYDEVDWLRSVQGSQDGGESWGRAVAGADEELA